MRTVLHKWFWVWDFDKEEQWLNRKAAEGQALIGTGFCRYEFEDCEPGAYQFRLELLEYPPEHPESRKYIRFLEETGVEQVGSYIRWCYFRKKSADGPFDLFSDFDSRIKHLSRIQALILPILLLNLLVFFVNLRQIDWLPFVNLACALLLAFAWGRIQYKKIRLKKEREISEN